MIRRNFTMLVATTLGFGLAAAGCSDDETKGFVADDTAADTTAGDTDGDDATNATDATDTAVAGLPLASVYPVSPTDTPELAEVELTNLTAEDGSLVGLYANVKNCVQDLENGQKIPLDLGNFALEITACTPAATVFPNAAGNYLDILPPVTPADDDGKFAELMMYHHMQVIHGYFKDTHGLTDRDEPLEAIVNISAHVDLCNQWARLPNAAFIPQESLSQLPFGLDFGLQGDAIVFSGTESKNFAYDATVIYHEYTHAILGATRLSGVFLDRQGLNNLPGALNESYADYFATSLIDSSLLGSYTLNDLGEFAICGFPLGGGGDNQARNMENERTCPDDLTAEVHADSEIFSGALWEIRALLGREDADKVILEGVITLTNESGFTAAADATVDAARMLEGEEVATQIEAIFDARQIVECPRVMPITSVGQRGIAVSLPGTDAIQDGSFPTGVPGYLQYKVAVPAGTQQLTIQLAVQAGGGLGGGGGGPADLGLLLKPGDAGIDYTLGFTVTTDEVARVAVDGESNSVTLTGSCLTEGDLVFAIHNSADSVSLKSVTATASSDAPADGTVANFDSCTQ
ncbi:MAG: hypothetical protein ACI9MR_000395 [Myxococcota bacterium]|jgi:hypothetical protein